MGGAESGKPSPRFASKPHEPDHRAPALATGDNGHDSIFLEWVEFHTRSGQSAAADTGLKKRVHAEVERTLRLFVETEASSTVFERCSSP